MLTIANTLYKIDILYKKKTAATITATAKKSHCCKIWFVDVLLGATNHNQRRPLIKSRSGQPIFARGVYELITDCLICAYVQIVKDNSTICRSDNTKSCT